MKKLAIIILSLASFVIAISSARAVVCSTNWPASFTNWYSGCTIPAGWLNAVETTIGTSSATSSLQVQITALQNTSGVSGSTTFVHSTSPFLIVNQVGTNASLTPASVLSVASSADIAPSNATGTSITFSFLNPKGFATTTIQSVLNALSAIGLASYNSSTGVFSVSSSSLNLGTASQYNKSDVLPSSTTYVATVNGLSGAITISSSTLGVVWPTVNGNQASNYLIIAGQGITSTVSGATTTLTLNLGLGCSGGNFVSTISPTGTIICATPSGGASSTNVYGTNGVTVNQVGTNATASLDTTYAASWSALETFLKGVTINGTTTLASTTNAITWANSLGQIMAVTIGQGLSFNTTTGQLSFTNPGFASSSITITGGGILSGGGDLTANRIISLTTSTLYGLFSGSSPIVFNTSTGQISWTNSNNYITLGSISANSPLSYNNGSGAFSLATNASTGIALSTTGNVLSIQNTGITTSTGNWAGTWQGVNSTTFYLASNPSGYISSAVTSINGNTTAAQTLTGGTGISVASAGGNTTTTNTGVTSFNGATGTVTYAPSTTIPTVYVSTVNGASGAITISSSSLGVIYTPTSTITASGTTVNGNAFAFGSTTDILAYASGTTLLWQFASHNISQFTNNSGYLTSAGAVTTFNGLNGAVTFNCVAGAGISVVTTTSLCTVSNTGVISLQSTSTAGGVNFSATNGSNITGILNSLAITQFTGVLPIANGGTNATSAAAALSNLGGISTVSINGVSGTSFTNLATGTAVAGSCTNCNLSYVNGLLTTASNGSGGTGSGVPSTTPWTAGYMPLITSTASAITNSVIYQASTTGNLGIGTTTPQSPLVIANGSTEVDIGRTVASSGYYINLQTSSSVPVFSVASTSAAQLNGQLFEPVYDNGTSTTGSATINWNQSNKQMIALGTTTTAFAWSNVQSGGSYTLWVIQDGTGSRTVTWPSSGAGEVQWASSTAPTLTTTANHMDAISFQCFVPHTTTTITCFGQYGANNFTQ